VLISAAGLSVAPDTLPSTASSVAFDEAATLLGWGREELEKVVAERGIQRGQFRRLARADIDALAADTELFARPSNLRRAPIAW
jgi:predicted HTH domain antitoxin